MHKVDGALNKDGTYSFTTGHFSTYAIMSEEEANPSSIRLDGVEIYRSLKKNSGYGKKPISTPKSGKYTNTSVKSGKKYYYKARGFVTIDGEKVYTSYSGKASRTVK